MVRLYSGLVAGNTTGYSANAAPTNIPTMYAHEARNATLSFCFGAAQIMTPRLPKTTTGMRIPIGCALKLSVTPRFTKYVATRLQDVTKNCTGHKRTAALRAR